MDHNHDTALYAVDVDDPILVEINRKLDSRVELLGSDDCALARPWFGATLDPDVEPEPEAGWDPEAEGYDSEHDVCVQCGLVVPVSGSVPEDGTVCAECAGAS